MVPFHNFYLIVFRTLLLSCCMFSCFCFAQEADPTEATRLYFRAQSFVAENQSDSAEVYLEKAEKVFAEVTHVEADSQQWARFLRIKLAQKEILLERKKFEQAISLCKEIETLASRHLGKNHPINWEARFFIGNTHFRMRNAELAQPVFLKMLADYPGAVQSDSVTYYTVAGLRFLGQSFLGARELDSALHYIHIGKEIAKPLPIELTNQLSVMYSIEAFIYMQQGELDTSLARLDDALQLAHKQDNPAEIARAHNGMGNIHQRKGNIRRAESHFRNALEATLLIAGPERPEIGMEYLNLGALAQERKDYYRAIDYYEQSIKRISDNPTYGPLLYWNFGVCQRMVGQYELAIELFQEGRRRLFTRKSADLSGLTTEVMAAQYHAELGWAYLETGRIDSAEHYLLRALEEDEVVAAQDPFLFFGNYQKMGSLRNQQNRNSEALKWFRQSRQTLETIGDQQGRNQHQALLSAQLAGTFAHLGQCDSTRHYLDRAQAEMTGFGSTESGAQAYRNDVYTALLILLRAVENCAGFEDAFSVKESIVNQALTASDFFQRDVREEASSLVDSRDAQTIFAQGIADQWTENPGGLTEKKIKRAFMLAEKGKARLLNQAMRVSNARKFAGISSDVLDLEQELRIQLADGERELFASSNNGKVDSIRARVFQHQERYDSLIGVMETAYPAYYQLKYATEVVAIETVQTYLEPGMGLLEFVIADSSTTAILILPESFQAVQLPAIRSSQVDSLRIGLYGFHQEGESVRKPEKWYDELYRTYAHSLYQQLIEPLAAQLPQRLIIIPDGYLGYLPFETLLTEAVTASRLPDTYPYWIQTHTLSYAFSASLLIEQSNITPMGNAKLLAFAPGFETSANPESQPSLFASFNPFRSDQLGALKFNETEVASIAESFDAQVYTGGDASRNRFVEEAGKYSILHLATHADLNERDHRFSYIAFAPDGDSSSQDWLYLADLYTLDLAAELVVLSACNTALGEVQAGEGIASLARGFTYAGAKSLVTTLWQVDDQYTAELMKLFYGYLEADLSKDEALRKAKLDILNTYNLPPFYWAAPVAMGDMHALSSPGNWKYYLITALVLIALLGVGGYVWGTRRF